MGFHISLMNLRQTRQPYQGIPPRQPGRHRQKPRLASPLRRIGQRNRFRRPQNRHPVPLPRTVLRRRKRVALQPFPVLRP